MKSGVLIEAVAELVCGAAGWICGPGGRTGGRSGRAFQGGQDGDSMGCYPVTAHHGLLQRPGEVSEPVDDDVVEGRVFLPGWLRPACGGSCFFPRRTGSGPAPAPMGWGSLCTGRQPWPPAVVSDDKADGTPSVPVSCFCSGRSHGGPGAWRPVWPGLWVLVGNRSWTGGWVQAFPVQGWCSRWDSGLCALVCARHPCWLAWGGRM